MYVAIVDYVTQQAEASLGLQEEGAVSAAREPHALPASTFNENNDCCRPTHFEARSTDATATSVTQQLCYPQVLYDIRQQHSHHNQLQLPSMQP